MAEMQVVHDKEIPLVAHDLQFGCISWDKCNDEMSLKRILHSLVIKDKFAEEFSSLIQVHPFNKELAATCYEFNNSTDDCSPTNLDVCQRCQIFIDKWSSSSQQICATCPHDFVGINWLIRESIFLLKNRTQLIDRAQLKCQLKGCNSIYNANQIYKASNITFTFHEFFKNSLDEVNYPFMSVISLTNIIIITLSFKLNYRNIFLLIMCFEIKKKMILELFDATRKQNRRLWNWQILIIIDAYNMNTSAYFYYRFMYNMNHSFCGHSSRLHATDSSKKDQSKKVPIN